MAWNGSGGNNSSAANTPKVPVESSPSKMRGLVALIIIVLGAAAAYWVIMSPELLKFSDDGASEVKTKEIKEVTPEIAPKVAEKEVVKIVERPAKPDPNARPTKVGEKVNGYVMLASGRLHKVKGESVYNPSQTSKPKYAIFKHPSENIIAGLLCAKPGSGMVGTPRYNGKIAEDFAKSLLEPIEISPNDSEEHKELKRLVQEAKENLRAEMDAGKDIEKILMDAREECNRLAQTKRMMRASVLEEIRKSNATDEDVEAYVEAANKLLEEKGIAPLELGPISRVKVKMNETIKE